MKVKDFLNRLCICNVSKIIIYADKIYELKSNERNIDNKIGNLIISNFNIESNVVCIYTVKN